MDLWIVTGYKFTKHLSFKKALREQGRLSKKHPHKKYELLRVKDTLEPKADKKKLIGLSKRLVRDAEEMLEASGYLNIAAYERKKLKDTIDAVKEILA